MCGVLLVALRKPHSQARPWPRVAERTRQCGPACDRGGRLEAVVAVVTVQHQDRGVGDRAFEVALEEPVCLLLALGHLHCVRELQLGLAVGALGLPLGDHLVQRPAKVRQLIRTARLDRLRRRPRGDPGREARVASRPRDDVPDQPQEGRQGGQDCDRREAQHLPAARPVRLASASLGFPGLARLPLRELVGERADRVEDACELQRDGVVLSSHGRTTPRAIERTRLPQRDEPQPAGVEAGDRFALPRRVARTRAPQLGEVAIYLGIDHRKLSLETPLIRGIGRRNQPQGQLEPVIDVARRVLGEQDRLHVVLVELVPLVPELGQPMDAYDGRSKDHRNKDREDQKELRSNSQRYAPRAVGEAQLPLVVGR